MEWICIHLVGDVYKLLSLCRSYIMTSMYILTLYSREGTIGSLMQILAAEPSDYSYFNQDLLQTWAGPAHWKVKLRSKGKEAVIGLCQTKQLHMYYSIVKHDPLDMKRWFLKIGEFAKSHL